MNIIPNVNRLLLKLNDVDSENTKSAGGLLLPSKAAVNKNFCTVLAVSDKLYDPEGEIVDSFVVGDTVIIGEYAGVRFTYENQELIMIEYTQVLGKFDINLDSEPELL